ncbi:hypothetical protein M0R45_017177 [Rubus argutus]|uniref:Uncharacterized protein n=1 Tax=Rubus argutus TaxID=59490 RepID=A0AAW1XUX9_RUBAR
MKLNNFAEGVKEVQNYLDLGKKAWEAERIALAERRSKRKKEWETEKIALTAQIGKELLYGVTIKILAKERECSISKCNQGARLGLERAEQLRSRAKGSLKGLVQVPG